MHQVAEEYLLWNCMGHAYFMHMPFPHSFLRKTKLCRDNYTQTVINNNSTKAFQIAKTAFATFAHIAGRGMKREETCLAEHGQFKHISVLEMFCHPFELINMSKIF